MQDAHAASSCHGNDCTVLCTHLRGSSTEAALLNGIAGHTLELDDGDRRAYGHPAVVVFSGLFPVAEALHASGRDFLRATAVGYEAFARIGQAANPGMLQRGFHTTGTAGALATAMAVGSLRQLDADALLNALGVAGLCSSGLCITFRKGSTLKHFNAGRAAFNGVSAAAMAAVGAQGADDILEGKDGFFQAYSGQEPSRDILLAPLGGKPFAVEGSYIKFYPSCRYTHAPIDAALALRQRIPLEEVREIAITTYPTAVRLTAQPHLPHDSPSSRFNMGFAVCLAYVQGEVHIPDFCKEKADDPRIQELFGKITYAEDASMDNAANNVRGARMRVTATDGRSEEIYVPLPVGEPENPAPAERYAAKFASLSASVWSRGRREAILESIGRMEQLADMGELARLLTPDL